MSCTTPPASRNGETLHYIHTDAPYTFTGNVELSITRGRNPWNFNLQILNPFCHQGSRKNLPNGDEGKWRTQRHEEKRFKRN